MLRLQTMFCILKRYPSNVVGTMSMDMFEDYCMPFRKRGWIKKSINLTRRGSGEFDGKVGYYFRELQDRNSLIILEKRGEVFVFQRKFSCD